MNKTFKRVLATFLLLCMIPATVLTAIANGPGVAGNSTSNQSFDNAKNQMIPETIVVDGEFNDTGWSIEGWNYVTSSTGNWDVANPETKSQQLMYQYQLRADYKYFYVGAVVVLPAGVSTGEFTVYLSDDKAGQYELTTAAFRFSLSNSEVTVEPIDCNTDDDVNVKVTDPEKFLNARLVDNNKYYIEFCNEVADTYNSEAEIRYFVSVSLKDNGNKNELFHPIYYNQTGTHSVPTSEFWPGGGNVLSYIGDDALKGAVTVDGNFDESIWANSNGVTDFKAANLITDSGWTEVTPENGGRWQNVDKTIDGFSYKYKMASDGTKLYVAIIINTSYKVGIVEQGTNVRIWFKTSASYTTYNYFYDINGSAIKAVKNTAPNGNTQTDFSKTTQLSKHIHGDNQKTYVEFSIPLSEFGGTNGFQCWLTTSNNVNGYGALHSGNYSDENGPWKKWDTNVDIDVSINDIKTTGSLTLDGNFDDQIWNNGPCDVLQNINSDVKYDKDYMYGKVTAQLKSSKTASNFDKIRLWVAPNVDGSDPYAVDLTSDDCEIIRLQKTVEDNILHTKYKVGEVVVGKAESKYTLSGSDVTIEFKVPLNAVGCKVGMKGNGDGDFGYYISAEKGTDAKTLYSTNLGNATSVNIGLDNYKACATNVTSYVDNGITIDGNLEEDIWGTEFINATFGNSVVMQRPMWGNSYEYSYKLYAGGNYLYGAVEFDGVANDSTSFTLWLDNGIDEYAWIGDNDASTPHIGYKVYPYSEETSKYTGGITISGSDYSTVTNGKETITVNRLQYYTNYKYEFKLGKDESSATPEFYFPTDSNLEQDKVAITKGKNYDYKIQTINGKTYLEFMIDVRNFHWLHEKSEGVEYITSMTHTMSYKDDASKTESITIYNPEINDRQNFWLTNINSENGSRHDGVGYLYNNTTDFKLPPTRYWSGIKFKPVSGSSTQYEIEDIVYGGDSKYYGKDLDEIFVYTEADAEAGKLYYFAFTGTVYNEYGKRYLRNLEINYPSNRYIDMISIEQGGKLYYINRHVLDGRSARATEARTNLFNWKKGDVVEFGYSGGTSSTTNALDISQLVSHKDLATTTDIEKTMPGWQEFAEHKDLPVLDTDEVQILSYEYEDIKEVGGRNNNTGYGADTDYSADTGKGFLNNDTDQNSKKNTMNMNETVVLYWGSGSKDAKDRSSIIADLGSAKTTNAYTAYLAGGGTDGLDPLSTSLEVYGSNDKSNWERITGASYRQILLQKGDGLKLSDQDKATANKPTVRFVSSNGNATAMSKDFGETGPSLSMLVDDDYASEYNGNSDSAGTSNWWWAQSGSKALLVSNNQAYKSDANVAFDIIFEYPIERSVNQIDITYFTLVNRLIGTSAQTVKVFTSANGEDWVHAANVKQANIPRAEFDTAADIYDDNHSVYNTHKKVALYNTKGGLGSTFTARYFKLTFEFPNYPGQTVYEKPDATTLKTTKMYEWNYMGFTEIDLTHTLDTNGQGKRVPYDIDSYSLTAVAEEPVNYRYLKYTLIETSPSVNNCIGLDEIEAHYSTAIDDLPKKNILHLNTDQKTNTISIDPKNDTYLGRYNTIGSVWQNNGSSMSQPNSNSEYTNQVFAETLLVPGFNYNANADVGFYSNFYIERVETAELDQPDKPDDTPNTNLNWDGRNSNVLKKLEHISPDRVVVDGNLNDSGWDGTWTDVDGSKNATNLSGSGTNFTYQLRADGEYLYVSAVINSAYNATNAPKFGIWLKNANGDKTYYSVGYGSTTIDVTPEPTAEYGAVDTLSIATKNGATYANGKLTFAYELVAKKNGNDIDSDLFGYTDEIMESTSDGIWVWEGRPQTQGFTLANESAMMSASGNTIVTGLNVAEGKTLVEFRVKLDEFGGKDGFEYFVEATSKSGNTMYPYIRTLAKHPENNWDSNEAIKVTAEDMTGWGDYRMVEDFAPVTSLGAKVNPSYNGKKTIRFGARYTEEFIRRQNVVEGTDYWDVADVGIIILPTAALQGGELTLDSSNIAKASAQDIVNWQNVPDEGTNFADYESFVFYVNLVGVEGIEALPLTFRSYVDYYNADNGSDTYYSIPLERSYDGVYNTANEDLVLPN